MSIKIDIEEELKNVLESRLDWIMFGSYRDDHSEEEIEEAAKVVRILISILS